MEADIVEEGEEEEEGKVEKKIFTRFTGVRRGKGGPRSDCEDS